MNLRSENCFKSIVFTVTIWCSILVSILRLTSGTRKCCSDGLSPTFNKCKDGKNVSIVCDGFESILNRDGSFTRFIISKDNYGEYLDMPLVGYIVREPFYCIGRRNFLYDRNDTDTALLCANKRIQYTELANFEPPKEDELESFFMSTMTVLNIISTLMLALTAFLYRVLDEVQDIQGKCLFHLTFVMCLEHACMSYMLFFETDRILPNMCITNLYILIYLVLVMFDWCAIVGYHSWSQSKSEHISEDEGLMKKYVYFGYGFPIFVVILSNLGAHMKKLYTNFEFELACYKHQTSLLLLFFVLPVYLLAGANIFFFWDTQKRLWSSQSLKMQSEKSKLKKMKYRLAMNGKLFIITGVLWSLMAVLLIVNFISDTTGFIFEFCSEIVFFLLSAEGIFVFLILVVFRKRVLKAISRGPFFKDRKILPEEWKTMADSETGEESENEMHRVDEIKFEKEDDDNEMGLRFG